MERNPATRAGRVLAALTLVAGCVDAPLAPAEPAAPEPVVARAGLRYAASVSIADTEPLTLRTQVRVSNTTAAVIELRVASHCTVLLRAYDNAAYRGRAIWDAATDSRTCTTLVRPVAVAPGETRVFEADARPVLARGRYFFVAVLRQADRDVELAAGHADVDSR